MGSDWQTAVGREEQCNLGTRRRTPSGKTRFRHTRRLIAVPLELLDFSGNHSVGWTCKTACIRKVAPEHQAWLLSNPSQTRLPHREHRRRPPPPSIGCAPVGPLLEQLPPTGHLRVVGGLDLRSGRLHAVAVVGAVLPLGDDAFEIAPAHLAVQVYAARFNVIDVP